MAVSLGWLIVQRMSAGLGQSFPEIKRNLCSDHDYGIWRAERHKKIGPPNQPKNTDDTGVYAKCPLHSDVHPSIFLMLPRKDSLIFEGSCVDLAVSAAKPSPPPQKGITA
jgi:hypothetical protein